MKHLKIKTKFFQRAALTMLLAVAGITNASASADWVGNSQIYFNGTWYSSSDFNGAKLNISGNNLSIGGSSWVRDKENIQWGDGATMKMYYRIDNQSWNDVTLVKYEWSSPDMKFRSGDANYPHASINISDYTAGSHTIDVYFVSDGWYDSNNSNNYSAKFTIAPTAKKALGDNLWTTFYCSDQGYKIDDDVDACAYTAKVTNSTVTLHKLGKVIPQNNAVIIVGDNPSQDETASIGITAIENNVNVDYPEALTNNNLKGVDVATTQSTLLSSYSDATNIYVLAEHDSEFGFYPIGNRVVPARKAFLAVDDSNWGGNASTRGFSITFEDDNTTSIRSVESEQLSNDNWFSLDGRRLSGKPSQRGIYINHGKKVIIK